MIDGTLAVKNGPNPPLPWRDTYSCESNQGSNIYSIKLPKQYKYITFFMINFCGSETIYVSPGGERQLSINAFYNSSLDRVGTCTFSSQGDLTIKYNCYNVSLDEIGHRITIHMKDKIPLHDITALLSSGIRLSCVDLVKSQNQWK
jgi:hypothetical protein